MRTEMYVNKFFGGGGNTVSILIVDADIMKFIHTSRRQYRHKKFETFLYGTSFSNQTLLTQYLFENLLDRKFKKNSGPKL